MRVLGNGRKISGLPTADRVLYVCGDGAHRVLHKGRILQHVECHMCGLFACPCLIRVVYYHEQMPFFRLPLVKKRRFYERTSDGDPVFP